MTVQYTDCSFSGANVRRVEAPRSGMTVTGYGRKLPTTVMVWYKGFWRRVYVIQISNAGSAYVLVKGKKEFIRDCDLDTEHADSQIQEVR